MALLSNNIQAYQAPQVNCQSRTYLFYPGCGPDTDLFRSLESDYSDQGYKCIQAQTKCIPFCIPNADIVQLWRQAPRTQKPAGTAGKGAEERSHQPVSVDPSANARPAALRIGCHLASGSPALSVCGQSADALVGGRYMSGWGLKFLLLFIFI